VRYKYSAFLCLFVGSLEYTTSSVLETDVFEEPQGALAWLQKPKTVRKREEVVERVNRGPWNGAEIGKKKGGQVLRTGDQRSRFRPPPTIRLVFKIKISNPNTRID
jgi:hypothetical protein